MTPSTRVGRRLPANVRTIQRIVNSSAGDAGKVIEYRIDGARGLVLHVLPSGTATWYFHYDVPVGRRRRRRKLKIGRLDEISLAQAIAEAETLRPQVKAGADPVAGKSDDKHAITFGELAEERLTRGDPLRPG